MWSLVENKLRERKKKKLDTHEAESLLMPEMKWKVPHVKVNLSSENQSRLTSGEMQIWKWLCVMYAWQELFVLENWGLTESLLFRL